MSEEMSIDDLRSIGEMLATESNLSESQALVYAFRAIGGMERQETVMELDMNSSTLDTHFQRAKEKMKTARLQTHLGEIYRGDSVHVSEGMTLPTVPEQWRTMPVQFKKENNGKEIRLFELPDNRIAKCIFEDDVCGVDIEAVGWFKFKTRDLEWDEFEGHFEDELGISADLSIKSKLTLGAAYQTMIEYAVTQWLRGEIISREYKYMEVEYANLAKSPSWVVVTSNDELVAETMSESLEATEDLRELKEKFIEVFDKEEHALIDPGVFGSEGGEINQFYEHVAQAYCRASGTDHPLTFDWDINTLNNREFKSLDEIQRKNFYNRHYWVMAYENRRYRLDMVKGETGIHL